MSGHTPGKWESGGLAVSTHNRPEHFWEVVVYADSTPVADAVGNSKERAEANARMIAAAPTVLAALKAGYWLALHLPHDAVRVLNQQSLCAMRDAIAEAEGRDSQDVQEEFEALVARANAAGVTP